MKRRPRSDALTVLLFRLPAELRLQIYDYLIPEGRLLLVPESSHWEWDRGTRSQSNRRPFRWLGVSREVFLDAGPAFYSSKTLYFWIDARVNSRGRSLNDALYHHVKLAHPPEAKWSFDIIRSTMLTKVTLEVNAPAYGEDLQSLLLRFSETAPQLRHYHALKELNISLRPQYNNAHHKVLFRQFNIPRLQEKSMKESWTLRRLCRATRQFKTNLPSDCKVKWYIPGKRSSNVPLTIMDFGEPGDVYQIIARELMVIEFMESMWTFICKRSDEELNELLSERDSLATWPVSPGR